MGEISTYALPFHQNKTKQKRLLGGLVNKSHCASEVGLPDSPRGKCQRQGFWTVYARQMQKCSGNTAKPRFSSDRVVGT